MLINIIVFIYISHIRGAYIPMLLLAFIILTVIDGANDLNARTANIAVIALAYVSFIPVLR